MLKIINQKWISNNTYKNTKYLIRTSKLIIYSRLRGFKYKYLSETTLVILEFKKSSQLYCEIAHYLEISKFTLTIIFY